MTRAYAGKAPLVRPADLKGNRIVPRHLLTASLAMGLPIS